MAVLTPLLQDTSPSAGTTHIVVCEASAQKYITISQLQTLITTQGAASGSVGPTGATGPSGPSGPSGIGTIGPTGLTGGVGVTGPSGPSGQRGVSGPSGVAGPIGLLGPSGVTGATGPSGASVGSYTATNIAGGLPGSILYQCATCKTGFINIGPSGYVLQSNGCIATWVNTQNFAPSAAASANAVYINTLTNSDLNTYYPTMVRGVGANYSEYASGSLSFVGNTGQLSTPNLKVNCGANASSTNSGALRVVGGVGIGGNLYVGGTINAFQLCVQNTLVTQNLVNSPDIFTITNVTNAVSTNTGALSVKGGVGIGKNLYVGGNLSVTGTIYGAHISGNACSATNLSGGFSGDIPYQSSPGQTTFLPIGGNCTALFSVCGLPAWQGFCNISVGVANTATNLSGGISGQIPYQSAPGVTSFISTGSAGQVLSSQGSCTPTFVSSVRAVNGTASTSTSTTQSLTVRGGLGVQGCSYFDSNVNIVGQLYHTGLSPSSGINVDQLYTTSTQLTLNKAWQNTGINGSSLANGTYIVQVLVSDQTQGGGESNMYYSGIMSWYSGNGSETAFDEIVLHRAGGVAATGSIFLQVQRVSSGSPQLQISGLTNNTGASTYTFNIRRMI